MPPPTEGLRDHEMVSFPLLPIFALQLSLLQDDAVDAGFHERVDGSDFPLEQSEAFCDLEGDGP